MKIPTLALLAALSLAPQTARAQECAADATYGTAVSWHRDVDAAAKQAKAAGKLLFVLHLSGELDDAGKT